MKKWSTLFFTAAALAIVFFSSVPAVFAAETPPVKSVKDPSVPKQVHQVTYRIVTKKISEGSSRQGKITVYRFDPGVYVVNEGDDVTLKIRGVANEAFPVVLEQYDMRGTIHQNETLILHFTAHKPGIFKLTCMKHADVKHQGPMEGYLVVIPKNR